MESKSPAMRSGRYLSALSTPPKFEDSVSESMCCKESKISWSQLAPPSAQHRYEDEFHRRRRSEGENGWLRITKARLVSSSRHLSGMGQRGSRKVRFHKVGLGVIVQVDWRGNQP